MNICRKLLCITLCALLVTTQAQADVWSYFSNFFSSTQNRVLAVVGGLVSAYCLYNAFWKKVQPKKTEKKADANVPQKPTQNITVRSSEPEITDASPGAESHIEYLSKDIVSLKS